MLFVHLLQAQYIGGIETGNGNSTIHQSNCNEHLPFTPFQGGTADGFAFFTITQSNCLYNEGNVAFSGGTGDGNGWNIIQQSICLGTYLLAGRIMNWQGQCEKKRVVLTWTIASETNNSFYHIERSIDALKWHVIGIVEATGKNRQVQNYTFNYDEILKGVSLYRLKLVNRDGSFEYSSELSVECEMGEEILLFMYPNPTTGTLIISGFGASADFRIYNLVGQKLLQTTVEDDYEEINLNHLNDGIYFIHIDTGAAMIIRKLIIKR